MSEIRPIDKRITYGMVAEASVVDREAWQMTPTGKDGLCDMVAQAVDRFIQDYRPEGEIRLTLTLEER